MMMFDWFIFKCYLCAYLQKITINWGQFNDFLTTTYLSYIKGLRDMRKDNLSSFDSSWKYTVHFSFDKGFWGILCLKVWICKTL